MTYCHVTAQIDRYEMAEFLDMQREMAWEETYNQVARDILDGDGCRYYCPVKMAYVVKTLDDVRNRAMLTDSYERLHDWYEETDSEQTRQRLGAAYTRLLERKLDEIVKEATNAIMYGCK